MRLDDLLMEDAEVFAALAVGYHRTRNLKRMNAIGESGFKAGTGAMYGTGIYLTYSFDDQQDEYMTKHYGPFVVRCKVNLSDFLIFDPDIATKVWGAKAPLEEQLKAFGAPPSQELNKVFDRHRAAIEAGGVTSVPARLVANWLAVAKPRLSRPVKGLVFTGENDGRVIVAYDPGRVVPFAWARVIKLDKTRDTVKWNKIATPPIKAGAADAMPEVQRATIYFRKLGFRIVSKGAGGARLVGLRDGIYITINISDERIEAYATRRDPEEMSKRLPSYPRMLGHRLIWQERRDGLHAVGAIGKAIFNEVDAFQSRPDEQVAFAEQLLHRLANGPIKTEKVAGPDFNRDVVRLHAGSVTIDLQHPHDSFTSGKIVIAAEPIDIETGFNDGTRDGGIPSVDAAYDHALSTVGFGMRIGRMKFNLPDDLQPAFAADLAAALKQG